ncbi:Hypothetical predicted protein [Octopus vulgaris]|uniref:Uncharacterized protein n=1 Tax=Octopus vulgaris TaxID=6645 RepID=A0AA36F9S6_OCTVU|nr:Hypothetical predicted protein [Octopus vulgaris]
MVSSRTLNRSLEYVKGVTHIPKFISSAMLKFDIIADVFIKFLECLRDISTERWNLAEVGHVSHVTKRDIEIYVRE